MKKIKIIALAVSSILATSAFATTATTNDNIKLKDQVLYHNTFPQQESPTHDIFVTNTEYANTVIMSNTIAGVMYQYLIKQKYPTMIMNPDYLIGSLMGQLMQESDMTTQINADFKPNDAEQLIDNDTYANILLSKGQGGPYQINDYSKRLPGVDMPGALGLVNYDAVAKALGYSIEDQDSGKQTDSEGPLALDNMYVGPMITTFYHFNDINRMNVNASNDWFVYHSDWNKCLEVSQTDAAKGRGLSFPMVMNVVYNAGSYSPVLKSYLEACANPQNADVYKNLNNWNLGVDEYQAAINGTGGSGNATYYRYPRQVSYYLQQMYNNNNSKMKQSGVEVDNYILFNVERLQQVFGMVMHKLSVRDAKGNLNYIPEADATAAFAKAVKQLKIEDLNLSFSNTAHDGAAQRKVIYNLINKAIANLAKADDIDFTKTFDKAPTPPTPPGPAQYKYPEGIGSYVSGTVVEADGKNYTCKSQVAAWCNNQAYSPLGVNGAMAWTGDFVPPVPPKPIGTWDPSKAYSEGDIVEIDNVKYKAMWWNKDVNPVDHHVEYQDPWNIVS